MERKKAVVTGASVGLERGLPGAWRGKDMIWQSPTLLSGRRLKTLSKSSRCSMEGNTSASRRP